MTFKTIALLLGVSLVTAGFVCAKDTPDQQREKIRKMASTTLTDLYKLLPSSQAAVQKSAGYAVFNNMGTNLLLLSTARGAGVAVNSKTKQDTFMKMISVGAGLGVSVKDYRVIFVFETEASLAKFMDSGRVCCDTASRWRSASGSSLIASGTSSERSRAPWLPPVTSRRTCPPASGGT